MVTMHMHLEEHAAMVNKQVEEHASLVICNLEEHAAILRNMVLGNMLL
jgi:hypothetical protein